MAAPAAPRPGKDDPAKPAGGSGAWIGLVWLVGFLATMVYCAIAWVRGPCIPVPGFTCLWDSTLAAFAAVFWPVYWPLQLLWWLL